MSAAPPPAASGSPAPSASALIFALRKATAYGPLGGQITSICHDSRRVTPGAAFVAVPGGRVDGHAFLASAVADGASMLVVQADRRPDWEHLLYSGVSIVSVPDTRVALGQLAAAFFGYPSRALTVVGITGTNGKTTTAFLTASVLAAGGRDSALLTTAGSMIAGPSGAAGDAKQGRWRPNTGHLTTPDVVEVQRFLAEARDASAVVECTSHGLDQGRLAEVDFDVAVVTNLDSDHLDYHGNPEAYRLAKARLFETLTREGSAVLNADDPHAGALAANSSGRRLRYGLDRGADVYATAVVHRGWRTSYRLHAGDRSIPVLLELPGTFNLYNSLAAAAVGVALGVDLDQIRRGLGSTSQVPGRMQRVRSGRGFTVVVDYAHNAAGLQQALSFLRTTTRGRLIAVFGCTGERDPGRRPAMAKVSAELADYTVVTTEDSWDEDPLSIVEGVTAGLADAGKRPELDYTVRVDRREAIELALSMAEPGDTVLVAGMGHEKSMMVAGRAQPWDDRQVVRELLLPSGAIRARQQSVQCQTGGGIRMSLNG
jgi:UDP-N-acetylmuramoyl-L-alanyl-D-glutamate--2,6-diaminopimelate ligase